MPPFAFIHASSCCTLHEPRTKTNTTTMWFSPIQKHFADVVTRIGVHLGTPRYSARTLKVLGGQDLPARTQNPKGETMDQIETADGP